MRVWKERPSQQGRQPTASTEQCCCSDGPAQPVDAWKKVRKDEWLNELYLCSTFWTRNAAQLWASGRRGPANRASPGVFFKMSITDTNIRALLLVANKHGVQKHSCIQISLNKMRWVTFEMNKPGDFLQQHNAYKQLTDMTHHLWHCPESLRGLCVCVCAATSKKHSCISCILPLCA